MKLTQENKAWLAAFLLLVASHCAGRRIDPVRSPSCRPINTTIAAEKDDCPVCMSVTTSICGGYCGLALCGLGGKTTAILKELGITCADGAAGRCVRLEGVLQEILLNVLSPHIQRVCTYKEVRYETVRLRGCRPGVDPSFTYPVALSCHCDLCKLDSSDCTVQSIGPNFCINQRVSSQ